MNIAVLASAAAQSVWLAANIFAINIGLTIILVQSHVLREKTSLSVWFPRRADYAVK
jgi:hypothetical protein